MNTRTLLILLGQEERHFIPEVLNLCCHWALPLTGVYHLDFPAATRLLPTLGSNPKGGLSPYSPGEMVSLHSKGSERMGCCPGPAGCSGSQYLSVSHDSRHAGSVCMMLCGGEDSGGQDFQVWVFHMLYLSISTLVVWPWASYPISPVLQCVCNGDACVYIVCNVDHMYVIVLTP